MSANVNERKRFVYLIKRGRNRLSISPFHCLATLNYRGLGVGDGTGGAVFGCRLVGGCVAGCVCCIVPVPCGCTPVLPGVDEGAVVAGAVFTAGDVPDAGVDGVDGTVAVGALTVPLAGTRYARSGRRLRITGCRAGCRRCGAGLASCANAAGTAHAGSSRGCSRTVDARRDASADGCTTHNQLHATIHLPSGGGRVCGHRILLTKSFDIDVAGCHALGNKKVLHGGGALFRKRLIVLWCTRVISKTINFQPEIRIGKNDAGRLWPISVWRRGEAWLCSSQTKRLTC